MYEIPKMGGGEGSVQIATIVGIQDMFLGVTKGWGRERKLAHRDRTF